MKENNEIVIRKHAHFNFTNGEDLIIYNINVVTKGEEDYVRIITNDEDNFIHNKSTTSDYIIFKDKVNYMKIVKIEQEEE